MSSWLAHDDELGIPSGIGHDSSLHDLIGIAAPPRVEQIRSVPLQPQEERDHVRARPFMVCSLEPKRQDLASMAIVVRVFAHVSDETSGSRRPNNLAVGFEKGGTVRGGSAREEYATNASFLDGVWWTAGGSNPRPLHCERSALPAELAARVLKPWHPARKTSTGRDQQGYHASDAAATAELVRYTRCSSCGAHRRDPGIPPVHTAPGVATSGAACGGRRAGTSHTTCQD
jgi:hypothetical protein